VAKGRPRTFDPDEALEKALGVFWTRGYEGASLPELTAAMGIERPSMYAAFGNKEALFRLVLDRYAAGPAKYINEALDEPSVRRVVEIIFKRAVEASCDPDRPRGCLLVQGAMACGKESESIRQELAARRAAGEAVLKKRFRRAVAEGDLPKGSDAGQLAKFVSAVLTGMAVKAADGATRKELQGIADLAMRAWPE
jgi:AcrR family transcriptional regulator